MAIFVPLFQGIQVECVYSLDNRILTNRLWFVVVAGNPTMTDLAAVGVGVKDWCIANVVPLLSSDATFLATRSYDATVAYPGPQVTTSQHTPGGTSDGSHSANTAIKMSFLTQNPPYKWLNWNFVGGIPKSAVNLNQIDPTYAHDMREAYLVLLDWFSLFQYRWEATTAVENGVPLSTRNHYRVDSIRNLTGFVSQRRNRLDNPAP
jgi:hypothetical protein